MWDWTKGDEVHYPLYDWPSLLSLSLSHTHTHAHIHTHTHTHTLSLSQSRTHSLSLSHTYTHTESLSQWLWKIIWKYGEWIFYLLINRKEKVLKSPSWLSWRWKPLSSSISAHFIAPNWSICTFINDVTSFVNVLRIFDIQNMSISMC